MGGLQFVEKQTEGQAGVNGLLEPSSVTVSPDGEHVYATGFEEGTVVVFARNDSERNAHLCGNQDAGRERRRRPERRVERSP